MDRRRYLCMEHIISLFNSLPPDNEIWGMKGEMCIFCNHPKRSGRQRVNMYLYLIYLFIYKELSKMGKEGG